MVKQLVHTVLKLQLLIGAMSIVDAASASAISFDYTPVIIQIDGKVQEDSVGFDLVKDCYTFFYKSILDGSVNLYESPAKKNKISPNQLQIKEIEHGVQFIQCNELFLLEFWKVQKRIFYSETLGFNFYHRGPNGDLINFGHIAAEDIQEKLKKSTLFCNANGQYNLSYWDAITSKQFFFNIVKFGKADLVSNPSMALELKAQIFDNPKITWEKPAVAINKKLILSEFMPSKDTTELGYKLCHALEVYLNYNRHNYFNLADKPALSYLDVKRAMRVDKIELQEVWTRSANGAVSQEILKVRPYVNGLPMNWLDVRQIHDFNMFVDYRPYVDLLESKHYNYRILSVNNEQIPEERASEVRRRLYSSPWNHITTREPR